MARDRKRAKQRQQQRRPRPGGPAAPTELHRADLPGALEHASSEVDEFDAALISGARGVPVNDDASPAEPLALERDSGGQGRAPSRAAEDMAPANVSDNRAGAVAPAVGGGGAGNGANTAAAAEAFGEGEGPAAPAHRERRQPLPRRAIGFLRASWAELQRVQWPDRPQVSQATAVVLGFVAVAGAYLGAADWLAQKIVNFIL